MKKINRGLRVGPLATLFAFAVLIEVDQMPVSGCLAGIKK